MPAGYLITFATYGSHLHGDDRGSIRAPAIFQPPNAAILAHRESRMAAARLYLDAAMRAAVLRAIVDTCRIRDWKLRAAHIRTEHVHIVLSALERPEPVMTTLKAWATRSMRETQLVTADARVWARHGSTRWLWNEAQIASAARYVYDGQGEAMARYP